MNLFFKYVFATLFQLSGKTKSMIPEQKSFNLKKQNENSHLTMLYIENIYDFRQLFHLQSFHAGT